MKMLLKTAALAMILASPSDIWAGDIYMNLEGAGTKDGSSLENALSYKQDEGALQKAWDSLAPGSTLYLEGGEYPAKQLLVKADGKNEKELRKISGKAKDGKLPTLTGTWGKNDKEKGFSVFKVSKGSTWWAIENFGIAKCKIGVEIEIPGNVAFGRIENISMQEMREGVIITGGADVLKPEIGSHDILIRNIRVEKYAKRGFRFKDGCYNITVENCYADAGGKEWATEAFHMGFSSQGGSEGVNDHDITFINCESRNNYWDAGEGYWNADGFCAERNSYNLTYIGCKAFDNTDGGWDLKTVNPLLIGCVALRNKKDFRFWSSNPGAVMIRCLGAYAFKRGGNSEETGLWTTGKVFAYKCSFVDNPYSIVFNDWHVTPEKAKEMKILLEDCIVTFSENQKDTIARIDNVNSVIWTPGGRPGEAMGYANPEEGKKLFDVGKAFDSVEFGPAKGYNSGWKDENLLELGRKKQPLITVEAKRLPASSISIFKDKNPSGWYLSGWKGAEMKMSKDGKDTYLEVASKGAGGASYMTKRREAVVDLSSHEKAKWILQMKIKCAAGQSYKDLKIKVMNMNEEVKTKEISLPGKFDGSVSDWQEVRIPLSDFLEDKNEEFDSFSGFSIRTFGEFKPLYIDQVTLEPK
ncbi:MAG TPA: hypothetical protein DCZ94_17355 [Lentisphaeria bacterium]|nr:MAG: hypothetical protein A2X48_20825 [Lentisphaerae bacterium GWF2_49_21]HBC88711.1 hypothetical protein [Lentisphaeria bacterium]